MREPRTALLDISRRWLEVEGELRVALLRVLLIALFYAAQLISYLSLTNPDAAEQAFHRQATWLAAVWAFGSLSVLVMVSRSWLPPVLKYVSSLADIALLSLVAAAGSGPASPLVMVYLLLIVMAGMRGSLELIWVTTISAMLAYLCLLLAHGQFSQQSFVPRLQFVQQKPVAMMIAWIAIAATGVVTGQLVRMLRQVITEIGQRQAWQATPSSRVNRTTDGVTHGAADGVTDGAAADGVPQA